MEDDNTTMVKATVNDELNDAIELIQDEFNCNKSEATNILLWQGKNAYLSESDEHRLAGAKPNTQPTDEANE